MIGFDADVLKNLVSGVHPLVRGHDTPQILYVEVASQTGRAGVIALAFERVLLEAQNATLQSVRVLLDDDENITQRFATPPSVQVCFQFDDVIEAMATDSFHGFP